MKGIMSDWKDITIILQKQIYESSQVLSQQNNHIFIYAPNIYIWWQNNYKLLRVAKQLGRFPNWNMSNREYRNRLDRATQIRCSVRWEGEEGTRGQPWAPCIALHTPNLHCAPYTQLALRPTHPTCIVLYTIHPICIVLHSPNLHCAPYTQMCVHPTQNKYFHRLLFKTAVADGNAVEFCWNISCRPGRELT